MQERGGSRLGSPQEDVDEAGQVRVGLDLANLIESEHLLEQDEGHQGTP